MPLDFNHRWITPVEVSIPADVFWCTKNSGTYIVDQKRWVAIIEQIRSYMQLIMPYLTEVVRTIFLKLPGGLAIAVWDGTTVPAAPTMTKFWALRLQSNRYPDIMITIPLPKATIYQLGQSVINFFDVPWPGSENWYYYTPGSEPALGTSFDPVKTFSMVRDTWELIEPLVITGLVLYLLAKLGLFSAVSNIIRSMLDIRARRKNRKLLKDIEKGVGNIDAAVSLISNADVLDKIKDLDNKIGLRLAFH